MKWGPVLIMTGIPSSALAADGGGGFSFLGGIFQMLASLAVVIGAVILSQHLIRKMMAGGLAKRSVPRYIRVVENRFLGPKKSLLLVEVGGEYLLLGSTENGLGLIKQIEMVETIEVVEELGQATVSRFRGKDFLEALSGLARRFPGGKLGLRKGTVW